mmetsp:Transcript_21617/g.62017  ORF Transcript_21617/g.62017 Transcript_21617/m.62017 type:complete len:252 (+) Transcript_21617:1031-1786(+)
MVRLLQREGALLALRLGRLAVRGQAHVDDLHVAGNGRGLLGLLLLGGCLLLELGLGGLLLLLELPNCRRGRALGFGRRGSRVLVGRRRRLPGRLLGLLLRVSRRLEGRPLLRRHGRLLAAASSPAAAGFGAGRPGGTRRRIDGHRQLVGGGALGVRDGIVRRGEGEFHRLDGLGEMNGAGGLDVGDSSSCSSRHRRDPAGRKNGGGKAKSAKNAHGVGSLGSMLVFITCNMIAVVVGHHHPSMRNTGLHGA